MSLSLEELTNAAESLKTSQRLLSETIKNQPQNIDLQKALRDSCIQRFEFCIELSWKISMKLLGLDTKAPNSAIREMAQNKLIADAKLWLDFIVARNKTSHSYDEDVAKVVYSEIIRFIPELESLIQNLKNIR